jgi:hypothetical protein
MFLPWLGIYIVVIMFIEGKITRKLQVVATNSKIVSSTTRDDPIKWILSKMKNKIKNMLGME